MKVCFINDSLMVGSSGLYNVLDAILINDHSVIFFNNPAITIVDTAIKYIVVTGNK